MERRILEGGDGQDGFGLGEMTVTKGDGGGDSSSLVQADETHRSHSRPA